MRNLLEQININKIKTFILVYFLYDNENIFMKYQFDAKKPDVIMKD